MATRKGITALLAMMAENLRTMSRSNVDLEDVKDTQEAFRGYK